MNPKMLELMQAMKSKMSEMMGMMDEMVKMHGGGEEMQEAMPSKSSALANTFKKKPDFGGMDKMLLLLGFIFMSAGSAFALTDVNLSAPQGFASAVSVSTTPTVFVTSTTLLNVEELRIWNYSADVMYINFTVQATSTTAAAAGIKIFQSSENNEYISLRVDKTATIYFSLAAASGTGELRMLQLGRKYQRFF